MAEKRNLGNADTGPNYGSTYPLIGAESRNPDAPGPYAPPPGGDKPTAPPSYLMNNVAGYEGTSTGGDDGKFHPPPPYPGPGPEKNIPPPDIQWSNPPIKEDIARQVFLQYVENKWCYSSAPAKEMVFQDFRPFNIYKYRLQSFTESRSTEWASEPYHGEAIDAYGSGPVPLPWDIPVLVPSLFKDSTADSKVPRTSSVKPCETCLATGQVICKKCHGSGRMKCWSCHGSGLRMDNTCPHCNGRPDQTCTTCMGRGNTACKGCNGFKHLLCYIQLKVTWKNNSFEFLADKDSGLSADLFKKATGQKIFDDEQLLVYPLTTSPDDSINKASQDAIQHHITQFASTCRILRQRHTIELIPLTKVIYTWKGASHSYFVYGAENQVFTDEYPAKCCCCSVM